jgi:hypothetical protein
MAILGMLFFLLESAMAQDLINTGAINNTGNIRVKNRATGLPDSVGGKFDYFGSDQVLWAKQYNYLTLTGSGTKSTVPGNVTVNADVTISSSVTLKVDSTSIMILEGNLSEQGYLSGSIQKTVDLSGVTTSSNFGAIGSSISWLTTPPGLTTATRTSGVVSQGNGNQSIKRFYDIVSARNSGLDATLVFGYNNIELSGQNAAKLVLWKSVDGGLNWRPQGGIVDTSAKTLTKSGITSFGRWTASDSLHPLGPLKNFAAKMFAASVVRDTAVVLSSVRPFVVTVTDQNNNPVEGETVVFVIDSLPNGATGQTLSAASAVTDIAGHASTVLTLGNRIGTYFVSATADTIRPVRFTAIAKPGAPSVLALASGDNQNGVVGSVVTNPFVVTVTDSSGNPVKNVNVQFTLTNSPAGATGQSLSMSAATTDSLGHASTLLTFGNKPGTYNVQASSIGLKNSPYTFAVKAAPGAASVLALASGDAQTGMVATTLTAPFVVSVSDSFGNAVKGASVQFSIVSAPVGSVGDSLIVSAAHTDSLGHASTLLVLGTKAGAYTIRATSSGLKNSPVTFSARATSGLANMLLQTSGQNQSANAGHTLANPFVVSVSDSFGNPVKGISVQFAIAGVPVGAIGESLSVSTMLTDSLGYASTILTLGNKVGPYAVQATSSGLRNSPLTFMANANSAAATMIALTSGDNQRGTVGTSLASSFVVTVSDSFGNPVKGANVRFAFAGVPAAATGESLSVTTAATDSLGHASSVLKLGNKIGTYTVQAASSGLANSPITFMVHATSGNAAFLVQMSGDHQTGAVTTSLVNSFVVTVTDSFANPVAGRTVSFTIAGAPLGATRQSLTVTSAVTDTAGQASTKLQLGTRAGVYTVEAVSNGLSPSPVTFTARATAGAAVVFAMNSGDGQSAAVGSSLHTPFTVTVTDSFGNAVRGVAVTFAVTNRPPGATGDSLTVTNATTDSLGTTSTQLRLGSKVGVYVVTSTSNGLVNSPLLFRAIGLVGQAVAILKTSGDNQSKSILESLDQPFVVTITDVGGNPVPGIKVDFAIDSIPAGSRQQSLSVTLTSTDSNGQASTVLTAGTQAGTYVVAANSAGLLGSPTSFRSRATVLYGDPNNDGAVNIADLTTVIDAILHRVQLGEADSIRADVNRDGVIDVRDAVAMLNGLLHGTWDTVAVGSGTLAEVERAAGKLKMSNIGKPAGVPSHLANDIRAEFDVTPNGLRFNLSNDVPVKGIQIVMRLRNHTALQKPDLIFDRAEVMQVPLDDTLGLLHIVVYNGANEIIDQGSGSIFRLPVVLADTGDFDVRAVIVSTIDNQGISIPFSKVNASGKYPNAYVLEQNYPNPFNNETKIQFVVPDMAGTLASVLVQIYDITGQKVATVVNGSYESGRYTVTWRGTNDQGQQLASGIYLLRLWAPEPRQFIIKKMILMK